MSPPDGGTYHPASAYSSYEADTLTSLLNTTATSLQIRSEVSSVLITLLNDVETTSTLSTHLVHKSHTASLQQQLTAAQTALAESRALAQHESQRRQQLGDAFLTELAKLSLKLEALEGWKVNNEGRVGEYDVLKRRLEEMTDRAQALELAVQEGQGSQGGLQAGSSQRTMDQKGDTVGANTGTSTSASTGSPQVEESAAAASSEDVVGGAPKKEADTTEEEEKADARVDETIAPAPMNAGPTNSAESSKDVGIGSNATGISDNPAAPSTTDAKAADDPNDGEGMSTSDTASASAAEPEVSTDKSKEYETGAKDTTSTSTADEPKKKNNKKKKVLAPPTPMDDAEPILECVPERVLMTIFASLEAQDILSTAQVSVVMYSRVDILFGLGGGGGGGASASGSGTGGDSPAQVETAPAEDANAASDVVEELPATKSTTAASAEPTSQPATAPTAASTLGSTLAGGLFSPFGRSTASKPAVAAAAVTASASDATSMNSTAMDDKAATSETTADTTSAESVPPSTTGLATTTAPTGLTGRGRGPMLTPELANSMAEKLSRDELAVIISMQKAQKASESDLTKLRNERDDLIAELKGVESVKDFLVAKLRDVERAQRMAESEKEKVARQVLSDQEVIAFLDYRVQELEGGAEIADRAKSRAEKELQAAQAKATEKTRVLSDMLRFERDQLAASEKEWKATKKVLVKEVKQCRAQIVSLEAERDGLREQNARLREALLSGGKK